MAGILDLEDAASALQHGTIRAPRWPGILTAADAIRDVGERMEGHPLEMFVPGEGLANYLTKAAYQEDPDWWDRLGVVGDLADIVPGIGGALGVAAGVARSTIRGAKRKAYPGIYKDLRTLLEEVNVAPESPNLGRLFNTSREELASAADVPGNVAGGFPGMVANPKGTAHGRKVRAPANTGRLVDALQGARDTPLGVGMRGWYQMDPIYYRLVDLAGPEEALRRYNQLNHLTGMASPGSDVLTELNRGTAANMLQEQGRFGDFLKYGGVPQAERVGSYPGDYLGIAGHPYHRTAQASPMQKYLETGAIQSKEPKVPLYIQAGSIPELGKQSDFPVGDAHWSRAVGLADVRGGGNPGKSFSGSEAQELGPWWRDSVAAQADLEAVPGQAVAWGLFSPQTGVETPVGAPKLELWADEIARVAAERGLSPEYVRDSVLMGKDYLRRSF